MNQLDPQLHEDQVRAAVRDLMHELTAQGLRHFLVGCVMQRMRGQTNPSLVFRLVDEESRNPEFSVLDIEET